MIKLKDLLLEISDAEFFVKKNSLLWKDISKNNLEDWIIKNFFTLKSGGFNISDPRYRVKKNPSAIKKMVKKKVNDVWEEAKSKTDVNRNDVEYKLWEKILTTNLENTFEEWTEKLPASLSPHNELVGWGYNNKKLETMEKRLFDDIVEFFESPIFGEE